MTQKSSKSGASGSPWPRYRSRHRELSHDQAHAETHDQHPGPLLDHELVCAADPTLITSQPALVEFINFLRGVGSFGYDSEFIGEHSYYPELCLIQVSTPTRIALIDPLSNLELRPFWALLADSAVEKVVHAGQPDLEPVARHLRLPPHNVFDTQIAAGFAGLPYPMALGKLLHQLTGAEMPGSTRGLKFSRWNKRPLTDAQIRYAANDVRYLPLMRRLIGERLHALGNAALAAEECQSLSDLSMYDIDPLSQRIRIRGVEKLGAIKTAALRGLMAWRDRAAREQNVPPRSLLRDETLYALAALPVRSEADFKQISGLPRPVKKHYGQQIVESVAAAIQGLAAESGLDDAGASRQPRINTDEMRQQVETLWARIVEQCAARSIDPKLATSKRELERVLRARHRRSPIDSPLMKGWRREVIGTLV